jgi:hypothetical protein
MKTRVTNLKRLNKWWRQDDQYVYVGRAGKGLSGEFGNPIPLEQESDRTDVLARYREYLEERITHDLDFRAKVKALAGKTLVCFCSPKPCHGDILAEVVDRLNKNDDA